ncbi:trehalose-phosphatase [Sphingomonas sp. MMS24-JH45]
MGAALHYRRTPALEAVADRIAQNMAARHDLVLQRGKMMVELRAPGDKGRAIVALLDMPAMRGTRPLFFGDDVTDEGRFRGGRRGGRRGRAGRAAARDRRAPPSAGPRCGARLGSRK